MKTTLMECILTHKAMLGVMGAWAYRELHLLWGNRMAIRETFAWYYAFLGREGGWFGILKTITVGKTPGGVQPAKNQQPS